MKPIVDGLREDLRVKASLIALNMDDGVGERLAEKHRVPPGGFVVYDGNGEVILTLELPKKREILRMVEAASAQEEGKEYFDRVAKDWDKFREKMFSDRVRDLVVRESHVLTESVVVDVGCGTGFLSQAFVLIARKVIGVDSSEEMLNRARNNLDRAENFEARLGTAERLPLEDGEADIVVGNMILHHCPNPLSAIREMARILKPGGKLILTDLDRHQYDWLREDQKDIWLGFDRKDIKHRFEFAGFTAVEVKDTKETCNTSSDKGKEIKVSIFLAKGKKKQV